MIPISILSIVIYLLYKNMPGGTISGGLGPKFSDLASMITQGTPSSEENYLPFMTAVITLLFIRYGSEILELLNLKESNT